MNARSEADPYLAATYPLRDRIARFIWGLVQSTVFRLSPRPCHTWRAWLLRRFGARLGSGCHIYPGACIWAPWNLECEDVVAIGDAAIIYNPAHVFLGSHATISQQAYLCGATHDHRDPAFPMVSAPICIGRYAWVCARATVQSGVIMGEGAVLGLGSVATRDLEPWVVYAGLPARRITERPPIHDK